MKFTGSRGFVVLVEVIYLIALFGLALYYIFDPTNWARTTWERLAPLPIGVLWFGALGSVIISLSGAFDHRQDWDPSWNLWHFTRPLVGVSLAIISWLIFQAAILGVGSQIPNPTAATPTNLLFYLIAFVVGYREDVFRSLIKRVADVIMMPGNVAAAPSAASGAPAAAASHAPAPAGTHALPPPIVVALSPPAGAPGQRVTIAGIGLGGTTGVRFGSNAALNFTTDSDAQVTATTPSGSGSVDVTLTTRNGSIDAGQFTYLDL
ncbi:MAG TPA: IPT/TIG domain-containing protein [Candidatus Binatia bacterium]|nr:IPT/TIG domain-containing protein [Candidatus Binatia bacterium]